MAIVEAEISMSLAHPDGKAVLASTFESSGAVVTSRRIYDGTGGWGAQPPFRMPVFVLTHRPHDIEV